VGGRCGGVCLESCQRTRVGHGKEFLCTNAVMKKFVVDFDHVFCSSLLLGSQSEDLCFTRAERTIGE
jgi:hypothetical protein